MKLIYNYLEKYPDMVVSRETFHDRLTFNTTQGELITIRKVGSKYQVFITGVAQDDIFIDKYELTPIDTIMLLQAHITNIPLY